jgi:hypothetical protein
MSTTHTEIEVSSMKVLALALAVLVVPVAAQAASTHHHRSHVSKQARGAYAAQIACTQVGCIPVPRGCFREGGRTSGDMPSGFDVITCPGAGTMYGNR